MRLLSHPPRALCGTLLILACVSLHAQTNIHLRVVAANLNGNSQTYEPFAIRILQGLTPDIVAIQEFNYNGNTASDIRSFVDTAFGTSFNYFRETNSAYSIPNGIISRYPIVAADSWVDTVQGTPNRGYAWARISIPGTNDLYVVSVHLLTSSATVRASEATNLKALIQANFPANAWIIVAGDFNTDTRTESCMTTFDSYLSDNPIPADNNGNSNTSQNRNHPHDYVLPSFSFTNFETASVFPSHSFSNGLVFDSTVYTPLSDVSPVQFGDSTNAQHMAVLKDFTIQTSGGTNTAPSIATQPHDQSISQGGNVTFTVSATGSPTLVYQWLFYSTNLSGASGSSLSLTNVQPSNAGPYSVIVTNSAGSVTSSVATLTVTNGPPLISGQPQNLTVFAGQDATFNVTASGVSLAYQWRFNGTNIGNATASSYTRSAAQTNHAGNYSVVITNNAGSITSATAVLTILTGTSSTIAQWDFNSVVNDASTTTGVLTPSIGAGTASYVGGTGPNSTGFASGSSTDTNTADNSAWNTTTYPASTVGNKTAGVRFDVSTAGRQNISIRWDQKASSSGSKYARLQYSTNGAAFVDFPTGVSLAGSTLFESKTNNLAGFPGVNDNPNFAFRIVAEFESTALNDSTANYVGASGTYASSGTLRFDMVSISGTLIPPPTPAGPALLSGIAYSPTQVQFTVTGTATSNYIVQAATDLLASNWISLQTNSSPFIFGDTNARLPARFYRAIVPR